MNLINKIIIVSIVLLHLIFVVIMRSSYTDIVKDEKNFNKIKETYTCEEYFCTKANIITNNNESKEDENFGNVEVEDVESQVFEPYSYDLLYKNSEVVIKGSKLNEVQQKDVTLSEMKIEEIYKGEDLVKFDTLKVYEMYFFHFTYKSFECHVGNAPMIVGENYILFLNRKYEDHEYRTDEENNLFALTTYDAFSKYTVNDELNFFEFDGPYKLNDILGYDAIIDSEDETSKNLADEYIDVHKEVIEKCVNN